jgi:hypothetical protein
MTLRLLTLVALAGAAGCARDLELPSQTGAPVVTSFSPTSAFGGQLFTVVGRGFEAVAEDNRVQFGAGASAVGLAVTSTTLVVRVPRGAADGPVTVTTRRGTSAAGPLRFTSLGGGEPATGQPVRSRALLHRPRSVLATPTDLLIESPLWGGLVSVFASEFDGDGASQAVALGEGTALAWLDLRQGELVLQALDGGARRSRPLPVTPDTFARLGAVEAWAGRPELLAFALYTADAGSLSHVSLSTFDATTLDPVDALRVLPLDDFWALSGAGRGRLALLGIRGEAPGELSGLLLVPPSGDGGDLWVPPAAGAKLAHDTPQPLVVGTLPSGHRQAVFVERHSLDLLTIDLDPDGGAPAFDEAPIALHALTEPAAGLAISGRWLAVSKRTEDLVLGVDLWTRQVVWSASTPAPGPATVRGPYLEVASQASNDVVELVADSGVILARWTTGFVPGTDEVLGGLAATPELSLHTAYPRGTLVLAPGSGETVGYGVSDAFSSGVVAGGGVAWTYGDNWVQPGELDFTTVPASVLRALPDGQGVWVVSTAGLGRVEDGGVLGWVDLEVRQALPPVALPDGRLAVAYQGPQGGWSLVAVSRDALARGTPLSPQALDDSATALFVTDGSLWLARGVVDAYGQVSAAWIQERSGASLEVEGEPGWLGWPLTHLVAVSPNGRMLVSVDPSYPSEVSLWRADPQAGFPFLSAFSLPGTITGLSFDPTGERAYVVTQVPEQLVVVE